LAISGAWRNVLVALYNLTMNPFEKYDLFFKRCGGVGGGQGGPIMGLMAFVLATDLLWVTSVFAQNFSAFETGDKLFDLCNVPTVDQRLLTIFAPGILQA
jgi:hypothetical protein